MSHINHKSQISNLKLVILSMAITAIATAAFAFRSQDNAYIEPQVVQVNVLPANFEVKTVALAGNTGVATVQLDQFKILTSFDYELGQGWNEGDFLVNTIAIDAIYDEQNKKQSDRFLQQADILMIKNNIAQYVQNTMGEN